MSERTAIPKSVRFEVFKRDSFTCQYCGRKAPEVVLNCDHIDPVANGGTNAVLNLITACVDCNSGKGARTLDERHILSKQRAQLDDLNERRVQLEMLAEWQKNLGDEADYTVAILERRWVEIHDMGVSLTASGRDNIQKWLKRFTAEEIMEAMVSAFQSYAIRKEDGGFEFESLEKAFNFIPRVATVKRAEVEKPYLRKLYYVRGILKNRLRYLREQDCLDLMEEAVHHNIDIASLESFAKRVTSWSQFQRGLEQFIEEQGSRDEQ